MSTFLRRHWLLLLLLAGGVALRVVTWLAYQPALLYIDTFRYLGNLEELRPTDLNPLGYTLLLKFLLEFGGFAWVQAVQHVMGILLALALYRLAMRYTDRGWLAAIVAAPVLLDAYQLQIEANLMSEILFQSLLVGMLWALLSRGELTWKRAALAGALLAGAVLTRTIGMVVAVPFGLFLLFAFGGLKTWKTRAGRRHVAGRTVAGLAGLVLVLFGYMSYYAVHAGQFGLTGATNNVLYGRTATFADCSKLPDDEGLRLMCPDEPLGERKSVDYYTHFQYGSSAWPEEPLPDERDKATLARQFSYTVILNQPLDLLGEVLYDFGKNFVPVKETFHNDVPAERWHFQSHYPYHDVGTETPQVYQAWTLAYDDELPHADRALASFMRDYQQNGGYTWGPLLAVFLLLGILGAVGVGKARRSPLRSGAFLGTGSALIILAGSSAFEFSWRYQLPALVLLPIGGVLGLAAMFGMGKKPAGGGRRPKMDDYPDDVDTAAVSEFRSRYGEAPLSPLVVVIAAYNEAKGIKPVLQNMPTHCGDIPVSTLVVVDGATDGTAEIAREAGAYVCEAPKNRGQGGALRLGYHLAAECGADWVVTTDADGQYDNNELPMLMKPLLDGTADFVTGSRRLGSGKYDSSVRWLGVRVFAWLASILTMQKITDTSFGFRAMPADLGASVTLREPQYQASELLLGVMAKGARVLEVPMTMELRNNGASKKGGSIKYGANYSRVMLGTWLREYVLRGGKRRPYVRRTAPQADERKPA